MNARKLKKKIRKQIVYSALIVFAFLVIWIAYQWWKQEHRLGFVRYPEFGISIPENYLIHGIDVSKYQDMIAWEEVQAMSVKNVKLGFVFIKATEGIGNSDPQFKRNWRKAREAGITRGAYHFFIASKDGKMQAENFINSVELENGDLPPVLDVEQTNGTGSVTLQREIKKWLETVENYYHIRPIIYTNVDFYNQRLGHDFDKYPLWVAHYYQPQQPRINRDWSFWQHSDKGRVNGILYKVDFNVFSGDSLDFKNLLVQ
ncbi:MAG: glycoside hydrolase family 25 protein [Chitinophagaceae bacterium]|jgi:lysozyme|nr:glycoside hydrolase family 25 protein [Chitinophagaceae bacterium]OQY96846.1 MAG: glycoside hydrolase [Sphingobacteriales bacterium UTBCD1]